MKRALLALAFAAAAAIGAVAGMLIAEPHLHTHASELREQAITEAEIRTARLARILSDLEYAEQWRRTWYANGGGR